MNLTEASGYASGGTSFPVIDSVPVRLADGTERVGLFIGKVGKYPLFDVRVALGRAYSVPNSTKKISNIGTKCTLGELNGGWTIPLIDVSIGTETAAYFLAELEARNGEWEEVMDVRHVG